MPVVIVSLFLALMAVYSGIVLEARTLSESNRLLTLERVQAVVADGVEQYVRETGTAPESLVDLSKKDGYTHLKSYIAQQDGGGVISKKSRTIVAGATVVGNGQNTVRVAVLTPKDRTVEDSTFLSASSNSCPESTSNRGSFESGQQWCAPRGMHSVVLDSRRFLMEHDGLTRVRMDTAATKILRYHETVFEVDEVVLDPVTGNPVLDPITGKPKTKKVKKQYFPTPHGTVPLAEVVEPGVNSYAGTTPATCRGVFLYEELVPIGCEDLYGVAGPISITVLSAQEILLTAPKALLEQGDNGQPSSLTSQLLITPQLNP